MSGASLALHHTTGSLSRAFPGSLDIYIIRQERGCHLSGILLLIRPLRSSRGPCPALQFWLILNPRDRSSWTQMPVVMLWVLCCPRSKEGRRGSWATSARLCLTPRGIMCDQKGAPCCGGGSCPFPPSCVGQTGNPQDRQHSSAVDETPQGASRTDGQVASRGGPLWPDYWAPTWTCPLECRCPLPPSLSPVCKWGGALRRTPCDHWGAPATCPCPARQGWKTAAGTDLSGGWPDGGALGQHAPCNPWRGGRCCPSPDGQSWAPGYPSTWGNWKAGLQGPDPCQETSPGEATSKPGLDGGLDPRGAAGRAGQWPRDRTNCPGPVCQPAKASVAGYSSLWRGGEDPMVSVGPAAAGPWHSVPPMGECWWPSLLANGGPPYKEGNGD